MSLGARREGVGTVGMRWDWKGREAKGRKEMGREGKGTGKEEKKEEKEEDGKKGEGRRKRTKRRKRGQYMAKDDSMMGQKRDTVVFGKKKR